MRMKNITALSVISLCLSVFFASPTQAHYPWINTNTYTPEIGESPYITVGWGHRYPLSKFLKKADLEHIVLIDPDGKKETITSTSELEFVPKNALSKTGSYLIGAKRKTGFYTKTTEGGKRQSKKGLSNILSCSLSHMSMKGLITVGEDQPIIDSKVGHPLEIIPLKSPTTLSAGDDLPIQLLLHGKPYMGRIYATYMGFSTEKDVFAYTAKTDYNGKGKIKILQPGIWLIKAEHSQAYPDQDECDEEKFIATLTLEVK
jgi:uncharacterized GH25 family protein